MTFKAKETVVQFVFACAAASHCNCIFFITFSVKMTHDSQDGGPSQSLFQVYYLGATLVDRRCSSSVMPWIVEELKLKTQEMKLLWLTPGKGWTYMHL